MPTAEEEALCEGFTLGLLCAVYDPRLGLAAFELARFCGGVEKDRVACGPAPGSDAHLQLRPRLAAYLESGTLLAACGRQWHALIDESIPEYAAALPALDLQTTAALVAGLPARSGADAVAAAYRLPRTQSDEALPTAFWESVLWAVFHEATRRGLDMQALRGLCDAARIDPSFAHCRFGAETLDALPPAPGVYIMREENGHVLYVGKAANLRRRLADYFRSTYEISEKLQAIRARIHDVSFQIVGSELEALLWEARLIRELEPAVNVQRHIAEGASRYEAPFLPTVVFERSVRKDHVEAFVLAPGKGLLQLRFCPARPPLTRLRKLIDYGCSKTAPAVRGAGCADWGSAGLEIALRYVARSRQRLATMTLRATEDQAAALCNAALSFLAQEPEAVEFREPAKQTERRSERASD